MHPSCSSSLQQGLICCCVCSHALTNTASHALLCSGESVAHKRTERKNTMQTQIHQTPSRLGRTQPRGGSEARNSLLSSANLYMIEKKREKSCALLLIYTELGSDQQFTSLNSLIYFYSSTEQPPVTIFSQIRYIVGSCGRIKAIQRKKRSGLIFVRKTRSGQQHHGEPELYVECDNHMELSTTCTVLQR